MEREQLKARALVYYSHVSAKPLEGFMEFKLLQTLITEVELQYSKFTPTALSCISQCPHHGGLELRLYTALKKSAIYLKEVYVGYLQYERYAMYY